MLRPGSRSLYFGQRLIGVDVTSTRTVWNLADFVVDGPAGRAVDVVRMRARREVAFMAARAIRFVGWRFPSHKILVGRVTADAGQAERRIVITWVSAGRKMRK